MWEDKPSRPASRLRISLSRSLAIPTYSESWFSIPFTLCDRPPASSPVTQNSLQFPMLLGTYYVFGLSVAHALHGLRLECFIRRLPHEWVAVKRGTATICFLPVLTLASVGVEPEGVRSLVCRVGSLGSLVPITTSLPHRRPASRRSRGRCRGGRRPRRRFRGGSGWKGRGG